MSAEKEKGKELAPYVRRRAFSKVHVTSWLIYLERDGFVRCSFQNCNFMAFDVEEMCNHYGHCNGDCSSTAQFVCGKCDGRTVSLKKLQLHQVRAHNITLPETSGTDSDPEEEEQTAKPSRVLLVSWSYFFDKHNYVKCSSCSFLANTLMEMGRHYTRCKQDMELLLYVCPECKGRTMNVNPLIWHMERSHKIYKAPSQFNHISTSMVRFWEKDISEKGSTSCLHVHKGERDCSYFDFDLLSIIEHSQTCKGPRYPVIAKDECKYCSKWTNSEEKLRQHIKLSHSEELEALEEKPFMMESVTVCGKQEMVPETCDEETDSDAMLPHSSSIDHQSPQQNEALSTAENCLETVVSESEKKQLFLKLMCNQEIEVATSKNLGAVMDDYVKQGESTSNKSTKQIKNTVTKPSSSRSEVETCTEKSSPNGRVSVGKSSLKRKANQSPNVRQKELKEEEKNYFKRTSDKKLLTIEERKKIIIVDDEGVKREIIEVTYKKNSLSKTPREKTPPKPSLAASKFKLSPNTQGNFASVNITDDLKIEPTDSLEDAQDSSGKEVQAMVEDWDDESDEGKLLPPVKEKNVEIVSTSIGKKQNELANSLKEKEVEESMYGLFQDESLALEDSVVVVDLENAQSENKIDDDPSLSVTHTGPERAYGKVSAKNYLQRPGHSKSIRFSPKKQSRTFLKIEEKHDSKDADVVSETVNFLLEEVSNHSKNAEPAKFNPSEVETRPVPENCANNKHKFPETISKSSEKSDKLMLSPTQLKAEHPVLYSDKTEHKYGIKYDSVRIVNAHSMIKSRDKEDLTKTNCDTEKHSKGELNETMLKSKNSITNNNVSQINRQVNNKGKLERNDKPSVIFLSASSKQQKLCVQDLNPKSSFSKETSDDRPSVVHPHSTDNLGCVPCLKKTEKTYLKSSTKSSVVTERITFNSYKEGVEEKSIVSDNNGTIKIPSGSGSGGSNTEENQLFKEEGSSHVESKTDKSIASYSMRPSLMKSGNVNIRKECFLETDKLPMSKKSLNKLTNTIHQINNQVLGPLHKSKQVHLEEDSNEEGESKRVSFLFQGSLSRRFLKSRGTALGKNREGPTRNRKYILEEYNDLKSKFKRNSYLLGTPKRKLSDTNCSVADQQNKVTSSDSEITTEKKNCPVVKRLENITSSNKLENNKGEKSLEVSEISRRISSDWCDSDGSEDEEDFLGTDEELDMKDHLFNGFQDVSEKTKSLNKRFHQFLNRLSESENEEWYVNAGNLSMDVRKQEKFLNDKASKLNQQSQSKAVWSDEKINLSSKVDLSQKENEDSSKNVDLNLQSKCKALHKRNHSSNKLSDESLESQSQSLNFDGPLKKIHNEELFKDSDLKKLVKKARDFRFKKDILNSSVEDNDNSFCCLESKSKESQRDVSSSGSSDQKVSTTDVMSSAKRKQGRPPQKISLIQEVKEQINKPKIDQQSMSEKSDRSSSVIIFNEKNDVNELPSCEIKKSSLERNITNLKLPGSTENFIINRMKISEAEENEQEINTHIAIEKSKNTVERNVGGEGIGAPTVEIEFSSIDQSLNTANLDVQAVEFKESKEENCLPTTSDQRKKSSDSKNIEIESFECTKNIYKMMSSPGQPNCKIQSKDSSHSLPDGVADVKSDDNVSLDKKNKSCVADKVIAGLPEGECQASVLISPPQESLPLNNENLKKLAEDKDEQVPTLKDNGSCANNLIQDVIESKIQERERQTVIQKSFKGSEIPVSVVNESTQGDTKKAILNSSPIQINNKSKSSETKVTDQQVEIPVPKKRGRPPKQRPILSNSVVFDHTVPENNLQDIKIEYEIEISTEIVQGNDSIDTSSQCNASSSIVTPVKKKRGRPPKKKIDVTSSDIESPVSYCSKCDSPEINKVNLDQSLISEVESVDNSLTTPSTPLKKKRGRPPKEMSGRNTSLQPNDIDSSVMSKASESDSTISVPKSKTEENSNTVMPAKSYYKQPRSLREISQVVPVVKRRGRPPKLKLKSDKSDVSELLSESTSLVDLSEISNQDVSVQPKKRGRKPKVKQEPLNETSLCEEDTVTPVIENSSKLTLPKKRGRKPKKFFESIGFALINDSKTTPKKRGRPPKRLNESSGDLKLSSADKKSASWQPGSPLLGTDVIFINEDKLAQMVDAGPKKRGRKPKIKPDSWIDERLGATNSLSEKITKLDENEYSNELDGVSGSDDGTSSVKTDSLKRKREKIDSDDPDYSDSCNKNAPRKKRKMFKKKRKLPIKIYKGRNIYKPAEDSFFSVKHNDSDKVVCGFCKKEMTYQEYRYKHCIFAHYMLCWIDGEEPPLDMSDQKMVVNRLWFAKKRLKKIPFRCFNCNLPKLSAVGFQSHIQFCGKEIEEKESLLVTCDLCGSRMMPSSLRPHMYIKHNSNLQTPSLDVAAIIPKTKRAAANRAEEVIQSQKEEEGPVDSQSRAASPDSKHYLSHLYLKPKRFVQPEEYKRWKKSLRETNRVSCNFSDCVFSAETTTAFRKHYLTCPLAPPRLFRCRKCKFATLLESEVHEHILSNHEDDIHPQSSEDDSSGDSDAEHHKKHKSTHGHYTYFSSNLPFKFLKSGFITKAQGFKKKYFFTEALKWTMKLRKKNFWQKEEEQLPITELSPGTWQPLSSEEASHYLPSTRSSMKFQGSDNVWQTLPAFQGTLLDGVPVIFTGGPVWAAAWAPVPDSESHQFLATASHSSMDITHHMSSLYNYKSIIQIWDFGHLSNMGEDSGSTPKFLLGLTHSRGAVWGLSWCPSGCFNDSRLGLLAAACADSSIAVYSIPRYRPAFEHTMYAVEPVLELRLGCEMLSQCTCVEWHSVAPHNLIVGGFANGMVALWDLGTSSPLLRDATKLYPFKVIEAHLSAVTAVSLSPTEDMYLMTASLDRATKFWRLEDTTSCVSMLRKASVMDATMPLCWLTAINAYDDVFSMNSAHVTGVNYRETFCQSNVHYVLQPGTVWSVSFNDWLNACACASEMGKITLFFRQQLLVLEDYKKSKKDSLVGDLVSCSLQSLHSNAEDVEFGQSYNDCVSKVGLQISFKEELEERNSQESCCSSDTMDRYPILSANKVTWNQNMSSFLWLAAGLQCGLVLCPRVKCLTSYDLSALYKLESNI